MRAFGTKFTRYVLGLCVALLLSAPALAQGAVSLTFSKSNPDGDGVWNGTVGGGVEGDLQTTLLAADDSQPVWLVSFEGVVDAGEQSFTAHLAGTLNTETGEVLLSGVVTEGYMLGSTVSWQGQMVDAEASLFEGSLELNPPAGAL